MPELTHDSSDDGFHEIQLSGKQLVFLFMSATVVLVVTFLTGVLVGRNVKTDRQPEAAQEIAAAATDRGEDLSLPNTAESRPLSPEELKAPTLLTRENPDETLPKEPPPATRQAAPEVKTPPAEQKPAEPTPSERKPAETKQVEGRAAATSADVPTTGRSGTWFLQVAALRNREAAAGTVRQLLAKGYPAYLDDSAPPLFRVRIGRYGTREEAARVAQKLQKEEKFTSDIRR